MLPGGLGCWSMVLLLIPIGQARSTTTTDERCFMNVSMQVIRTRTVSMKEIQGWWLWRRTRTVYKSKSFMVTEMKVVPRPCNATTLTMFTDPTTQVPSTEVNDLGLSNGSGQQDDQPSSGQIAGFVIGVIAIVTVVVVIIVVVVFIRRKRKRKQSQKANMPAVSSSGNSAGATVYYAAPEMIRDRKRRQKVTYQDGADLSSNQIESGGDETGSGQATYSYNHLREAVDLYRGGDLATNTYDHLQGNHETQLEDEDETNPYYNVEATGTSAKACPGLNTEYDNVKH